MRHRARDTTPWRWRSTPRAAHARTAGPCAGRTRTQPAHRAIAPDADRQSSQTHPPGALPAGSRPGGRSAWHAASAPALAGTARRSARHLPVALDRVGSAVGEFAIGIAMAGGMALAHHALQSLRVVQIGVEQAAFDIARGLFDGVARAGSLLGDVLIALVRQARAMDERLTSCSGSPSAASTRSRAVDAGAAAGLVPETGGYAAPCVGVSSRVSGLRTPLRRGWCIRPSCWRTGDAVLTATAVPRRRTCVSSKPHAQAACPATASADRATTRLGGSPCIVT